MPAEFLEQLPKLIQPGRRVAQRLFDARKGRNRERAVLKELIRPVESSVSTPEGECSRMLCGDPASALAALLAEQASDAPMDIVAAVIDVPPVDVGDTGQDDAARRLSASIPVFELIRKLMGDTQPLFARFIDGESPTMRLVFEAFWSAIPLAADAVAPKLSATSPRSAVVFCSDDADWLAHAVGACEGRWIACIASAAQAARFRRLLIARNAPAFSHEAVGAAPIEWARRHVGAGHLVAMHAALWAFGATPDVAAPEDTSTRGRTRAPDHAIGFMDHARGRTLVWVDSPDRCTTEASLCRVLSRHARTEGCDRIVLLAWHVAPTLPQAIASRHAPAISLHTIRVLPRVNGGLVRIDPAGFKQVAAMPEATVTRHPAGAKDHEWLDVEWARGDEAPLDWSIDPDFTDDIFRGAWHAARESAALPVRSVRLRVPWRNGARRVCLRITDASGRIADIVHVVRHAPDVHVHAPRARRPEPPRHEALC